MTEIFNKTILKLDDEIGRYLNEGNMPRALDLFPKLLKEMEKNKEQGDAYYMKYTMYIQMLAFLDEDKAIKEAKHLVKIFPNFKCEYASLKDVYLLLSTLYSDIDEDEEALTYLKKSYETAKALDSFTEYDEGYYQGLFGQLYYFIDDNKKALEALRKSVIIYEKYKNDEFYVLKDHATAVKDLGEVKLSLSDSKEGYKELYKAIDLYSIDENQYVSDIAEIYAALDMAYSDREDINGSLDMFNRALKFIDKHPESDNPFTLTILLDYMLTLNYIDKIDEALKVGLKATEFIKKYDYIYDDYEITTAFKVLSDIYYDKKDNANALKYARMEYQYYQQMEESDSEDVEECKNRIDELKSKTKLIPFA